MPPDCAVPLGTSKPVGARRPSHEHADPGGAERTRGSAQMNKLLLKRGYFIAPATIPLMMYFWAKMNRTTTGAMAIRTAVSSSCHSVTNAPA